MSGYSGKSVRPSEAFPRCSRPRPSLRRAATSAVRVWWKTASWARANIPETPATVAEPSRFRSVPTHFALARSKGPFAAAPICGHPCGPQLVVPVCRGRTHPSKVPHMQIRAGERFVCVGPAGDGYGSPCANTRAGPPGCRRRTASVEGARRDYAVALTSPGSVDEAETARLRAMR